jgi:hypothetical protein
VGPKLFDLRLVCPEMHRDRCGAAETDKEKGDYPARMIHVGQPSCTEIAGGGKSGARGRVNIMRESVAASP